MPELSPVSSICPFPAPKPTSNEVEDVGHEGRNAEAQSAEYEEEGGGAASERNEEKDEDGLLPVLEEVLLPLVASHASVKLHRRIVELVGALHGVHRREARAVRTGVVHLRGGMGVDS